MKKIIILCIIAVIACAGVWFFRDKTMLKTSSGWKTYPTNCRELLDDGGKLNTTIYSSFGLSRMKKLTRLEVKSLNRYDFLEELDELEELDVRVDEEHPLDLSTFPEVRSLKQLVINNGDYIEACTYGISDKFPRLESIWFIGGHISDENMRDISKCPELKRVLFWGFDRQPFDLSPLTKAEKLEELDLQDVFPKMDLTPLSEMSGLKVLECTVYNEEEIEITSHLSSLKELYICSSSCISEEDDKLELPDNYFDELDSLEEFAAYDFKIGDDMNISSLPSGLKKMTFKDCYISEKIKNKISEMGIDIEITNSTHT